MQRDDVYPVWRHSCHAASVRETLLPVGEPCAHCGCSEARQWPPVPSDPRPIDQVTIHMPSDRALAGAVIGGSAAAALAVAFAVSSATPPNLEELLCAAAYGILTDGRTHRPDAQSWAVQYLARCTPGRDRTSFVRQAMRKAPLANDRRHAHG